MHTEGSIWGLNVFGVLSTVFQVDDVLRWIQLSLTIIAIAVSLGLSIYKWVITARADGKITKEEIEDLGEIIKDKIEDVKDVVEGEIENDDKQN